MDIKFDAVAAKQLIRQMDWYCSGIQKEARDLLDIFSGFEEWNDQQAKAFQNNIVEIANDLNKVLFFESDYIRMFYQRVMELGE